MMNMSHTTKDLNQIEIGKSEVSPNPDYRVENANHPGSKMTEYTDQMSKDARFKAKGPKINNNKDINVDIKSRPHSQAGTSKFNASKIGSVEPSLSRKIPTTNFAFRNQQIADTPYYLVKKYPDQGIIKQTDYSHNFGRDVECKKTQAKFSLQKARGDFVSNYCKNTLSEERFNLHPNFDKSTYLSKVQRIKFNRNFSNYTQRTDQLIKQGGNPLQELDEQVHHVYDNQKKDKLLMMSLNKGIIKFKNQDGRNKHRSIYRREQSRDPYDFERIQAGLTKTVKGASQQNLVPMAKQSKRDMNMILKSTEAYANIKRENDNADYLKMILSK